MTIITHKHDDTFAMTGADKSQCSFCDKKLYPPFLWWNCENKDIFVCGPCAKRVKAGLTCDLIHLAAIQEIREIYPAWTLQRKHLVMLKKEAEVKAIAWAKHLNGEDYGPV